eukprot:CCRYP_010515-RB/>CCRYP_010515-RB protein AED:0.45 eAED:1.00 QI:0/0/0/1/0/0/2/0/291
MASSSAPPFPPSPCPAPKSSVGVELLASESAIATTAGGLAGALGEYRPDFIIPETFFLSIPLAANGDRLPVCGGVGALRSADSSRTSSILSYMSSSSDPLDSIEGEAGSGSSDSSASAEGARPQTGGASTAFCAARFGSAGLLASQQAGMGRNQVRNIAGDSACIQQRKNGILLLDRRRRTTRRFGSDVAGRQRGAQIGNVAFVRGNAAQYLVDAQRRERLGPAVFRSDEVFFVLVEARCVVVFVAGRGGVGRAVLGVLGGGGRGGVDGFVGGGGERHSWRFHFGRWSTAV